MNISLEQITQESVIAGKENNTGTFSNLLGDLNKGIRSFFTLFNDQPKINYEVSDVETALIRFNSEHGSDNTYQSVKTIGIYVPPGLNGRFALYADALAKVNLVAGDVENLYLKPIKRYVALVINDPTKLSAISSDVFDPTGQKINEVTSLTKKFLTNTTKTDMAYFGDAYANMADIDLTVDNLIIAKRNLDRNASVNVKQSATELTQLVDRLIIRMKQKPELYKLNPMGTKNLAELLHTAGRAVEFHGAASNETRIAIKAFVDSF